MTDDKVCATCGADLEEDDTVQICEGCGATLCMNCDCEDCDDDM